MANEQNPDFCKLPPVCDHLFQRIDDRLGEMRVAQIEQHRETNDALKSLTDKVLNGITAQLNTVKMDILTLQQQRIASDQERAERLRRSSRWESAVITLVVGGIATILWFTVRQYVVHGQKIP